MKISGLVALLGVSAAQGELVWLGGVDLSGYCPSPCLLLLLLILGLARRRRVCVKDPHPQSARLRPRSPTHTP